MNVDDLGDYRPGQRAAKLHEVKAPLVDAALTKAEIRELSRIAGLATWDRPASACLSSRIPYGTPVTIQNVKTVDRGEDAIRALGFRQFRVRFHGDVVRIEIAPEEMERAMNVDVARRFTAIFKALGFHYVTLDLEGYRQGSLNAVLAAEREAVSAQIATGFAQAERSELMDGDAAVEMLRQRRAERGKRQGRSGTT